MQRSSNYLSFFNYICILLMIFFWKLVIAFSLLSEVDFFIMFLFFFVIYMVYIKMFNSVLVMLSKLVLKYEYIWSTFLYNLIKFYKQILELNSVRKVLFFYFLIFKFFVINLFFSFKNKVLDVLFFFKKLSNIFVFFLNSLCNVYFSKYNNLKDIQNFLGFKVLG